MPVHNPNTTARYKWFYTVAGRQHTAQLRAATPFSPADMGEFLSDWYIALSPALHSGIVNEVQLAVAGSDLFNPVLTGAEGLAFGGAGAGTLESVPQYLDFVGRATDGVRVRLAQFGLADNANDYRYTASDSGVIASATTLLNGLANAGLAVSGAKAIWKKYANTGYNAYWQRAVRS